MCWISSSWIIKFWLFAVGRSTYLTCWRSFKGVKQRHSGLLLLSVCFHRCGDRRYCILDAVSVPGDALFRRFRSASWRDESETDGVRRQTRWVCLRGPLWWESLAVAAVMRLLTQFCLCDSQSLKSWGEVRVAAMLNILRSSCLRIDLMNVCAIGTMDVEEKTRKKSNVYCFRMCLWLI